MMVHTDYMTIKNLRPHSKIWIERDGQYAFGGGVAEILSAVHKTGSIRQASKLLGESYRYVWGRIRKAEEVLGIILVETTIGGQDEKRARLTKIALALIKPYIRFETKIRKEVNNHFDKIINTLNKYK